MATTPVTLQRRLVQWEVPHLGSSFRIQMYINPSNFVINSVKDLSEVRTKGGYILQYWGEKFDEVQINGKTGSSGVEGINALKDIYRSEQLALWKIIQNAGDVGAKRRQSLAQLAASVILHYDGVQYYGYFKTFSVTETAEEIGHFNYQMTFTVTKTAGLRKNWLGWHRTPKSTSDTPTAVGTSAAGGRLTFAIKRGNESPNAAGGVPAAKAATAQKASGMNQSATGNASPDITYA